MTTWYVASLSRYVLVRADTAEKARDLGQGQLPTLVRTVRLATDDEIDLMAWHDRQMAGSSPQGAGPMVS